jgi:hypothetical protein
MLINLVMGAALVGGAKKVPRRACLVILCVLHALVCLPWGLSWLNVETSVYTLCIYMGLYALSCRVKAPLAVSTVAATAIFFLVSNAVSWLQMSAPPIAAYTRDANGLFAAYIAGLPFLRATAVKNLLGVGVCYALVEGYHAVFGKNRRVDAEGRQSPAI